PLVVLFDHLILALDHLRQVELQSGDFDAVCLERMACMLEILGRLQQGLRRNAADIRASAAGRRAALAVLPGIDAGDLESELRGADRRDIAARARADDHDIELLSHRALLRCRTTCAPDPRALPSSRPGPAPPRDHR